MYEFTYCAPTKIFFGENTELKVGEAAISLGCKKVFFHYGGKSAISSRLIERVKTALASAGVEIAELGGVAPNPRLSLVEKGIALCKDFGAQLVLAVGGGSVIDSAKAIALGAVSGGDVWDFYCGLRKAEKTLPVGVVLTLSASGSEMSNSSVITNDRGEQAEKRGLNSEIIRPAFAMLNPALTLTVPAYQTACGCADIFMHTAERYFTGASTMRVTDNLAEALMSSVVASSKTVMNDLSDYSARADLMWAGSVSHNGLTGFGTDGGDWAVHALGHEISALFDTAHGAALTAVWGSWARYVYKENLNRFHRFAVQVMGVRPSGTREELALKGIEAVEEWFASLGLPTSLNELGVNIDDKTIALMAKNCAAHCGGSRGSIKKLYEGDMLAIYSAAR